MKTTNILNPNFGFFLASKEKKKGTKISRKYIGQNREEVIALQAERKEAEPNKRFWVEKGRKP